MSYLKKKILFNDLNKASLSCVKVNNKITKMICMLAVYMAAFPVVSNMVSNIDISQEILWK